MKKIGRQQVATGKIQTLESEWKLVLSYLLQFWLLVFFSFWLGRYFIDKCYVRLTLLHSWVNKNKINRTCKKYYQELHDIWCDVVVVEEEKWNNNWDYLIPLSIIIRQFNCTHTHIIRGKIVNCAKQRKNERTRPDVEHYLLDACAIYPMR